MTGSAPADWEAFRSMGHRIVDTVADYYKNVATMPVRSQVAPGYLAQALPGAAPEEPESFEAVMTDFQALIVPGVTHWQHPSFFAYFSANSSPPAIIGDILSDMLNCISFSWVASPSATELETVVMDWLGKACALPPCFLSSSGTGGGVIQGSASEASLVAMLAARRRMIDCVRAAAPGAAPLESDAALASRFVAYCSDQTHSSVKKGGTVCGLDPALVRALPADEHFRLDPAALAAAMAEDTAAGRVPFFCCATVGTTSSCAVDPLPEIARVCAQFNVYVHVDAAYAGCAMVCEEYQHHLSGLEQCHSFAFNPHKWLLVNFDCCAMWVRDRRPLLAALSLTPEYLKSSAYNAGLVTDYRDWQIPLGRRFRSLKLWFVMRMYGLNALRAHIRKHCAFAQDFERLVHADPRFELVAPTAFSLVCFRLRPSALLLAAPADDAAVNAANLALLEAVNAGGTTFLIHTKLREKITLRFAVGAPLTESVHVESAWRCLQAAAQSVIAAAAAPAADTPAPDPAAPGTTS